MYRDGKSYWDKVARVVQKWWMQFGWELLLIRRIFLPLDGHFGSNCVLSVSFSTGFSTSGSFKLIFHGYSFGFYPVSCLFMQASNMAICSICFSIFSVRFRLFA